MTLKSIKTHICYERCFASFHCCFLLILFSDFSCEITFNWLEHCGYISLMTWEKLYLRWRWEDIDSEESLEDLEGLATSFPLSNSSSGMEAFNLFLAWEDYTGETTRSTWEFGLNGGGGGGNENDIVGQPWWSCATVWWTISCHPSLAGGSSCIETWGGRWILEKFWCGWKWGILGLGFIIPWLTRLKNPSWKNWFSSCRSTSKCIKNHGLLWPLCQLFTLPLFAPLPLPPLLKKLILKQYSNQNMIFFLNPFTNTLPK